MPASIKLTKDTLTVHIEGPDQRWAMKTQLQVPLANVVCAQDASREADSWLHNMRVGGTHIPGVISVGLFYSHGGFVFWDVHDPEKAIAIELLDERYHKIVVEVENPDQDIASIEEAIATATTPSAVA
jgi:hypothetical protein